MELLPILMELNKPIVLSVVFLLSLVLLLKLAKKSKLNLPPSPPKLPIIGNLHQLGKLPHRSLRDLSRKYGSLFLIQLGQNRTLVVSSAEMAEEITKSQDLAFSNRPNTTAAKILFYGCKDFAFSPYGEYWRQLRRICIQEVLSLGRIQSFRYIREEETEVLVNNIHRRSLKGDPIDLSEMLMAVTNNIASRCIFSKKTVEQDGGNKFGRLARRFVSLLMAFSFGDMFPYLGWLDMLSGLIPKLKATFEEFDVFLDQIIEEHRTLQTGDDQKDIVSIFLDLQKDGLLEMNLTQDIIKANLLDMFIGGTDTIATTIEWAMAELLRHPTTMEKVQEEVRNVVGKKTKIDENDINKMKYFKFVIKETLRLHPPGPLLVPRKTTACVKVGGYDIPSNVLVFFNAFSIQRDPTWWENSEEFIPERFENSPVDYKGHDFQFIPFGSGRRGCPGMPFAIPTIEYVIVNLLCWFDWKFPSGEVSENLDMDEEYGLAVTKKVPIRIVPISFLSI